MGAISTAWDNMPMPFRIFAIIVVLLFIISIIVAIMRLVRNVSRATSKEKYRKNPNGSNLTPAEQSAINIGAIIAEQTGIYTDSIETGYNKTDRITNLYRYYDIKSNQTANELLSSFVEGHHSKLYPTIIDFYLGVPKNEWKSRAKELLGKDSVQGLMEYLNNIDLALPYLIEKKYITKKEDLEHINLYAWDAGRAVLVSRMSYDSKYLNKDEAWQYINTAYEMSKVRYNNWQDFAVGYLVGRAIWGGTIGGIDTIADGLLSDEDSPWKTQNFK